MHSGGSGPCGGMTPQGGTFDPSRPPSCSHRTRTNSWGLNAGEAVAVNAWRSQGRSYSSSTIADIARHKGGQRFAARTPRRGLRPDHHAHIRQRNEPASPPRHPNVNGVRVCREVTWSLRTATPKGVVPCGVSLREPWANRPHPAPFWHSSRHSRSGGSPTRAGPPELPVRRQPAGTRAPGLVLQLDHPAHTRRRNALASPACHRRVSTPPKDQRPARGRALVRGRGRVALADLRAPVHDGEAPIQVLRRENRDITSAPQRLRL